MRNKYIRIANKSLRLFGQAMRRASFAGLALALAVSGLQAITHLAAAAQVSSRSIKLSNAAGGGTGVTYEVQFTTSSTNYTVQGIVVDFCDNDPIIGDSCTAPSGFTIGASPSVTVNSGLTGTWTAGQLNSGRTLTLTNGTGTSVTSTTVNFDITGVTNPGTSNHSFFARILTYTTTGAATGYSAGSEGSYTDYGGVALSTSSTVNITAKVMESLSFCVYHSSCGDDPTLALGHGTNTILDGTAVDTASDSFSLSTNAQSGAIVRMKGSTLTSGSNTIPAVNAGSATPSTITAGTAAFGMDIPTPGAMTVSSTYVGTGTTSSNYGLDTTTGNSITGVYGGTVASISGPTNSSTSSFTFAATASNTTPAGIYTASEQMIATATF